MKTIKESFVIRLDNENQLFEVLTNIKENSNVKWNGIDEINPEDDVEIFEVYRKSTCLVLRHKTELYYDTITSLLEGDHNGNRYDIGGFNDIWE